MSRKEKMAAPATCSKLKVSMQDLQRIRRKDLIDMLFLIYLIREFETAVLKLLEVELVHGPVHSSIGQEAIAAAAAVVLGKKDLIGATHRAHGQFLSKAFMYYAPEKFNPLEDEITPEAQRAVNKTLAEIMGLRDGWCGGRGGSMHLYDGTSGNLGSNAIVGGGIPLATGAALAEKMHKNGTVVVSFFGDGAINQGCFHEVANMAALWDLPILYFVENNAYAVGTSVHEASHVEDLALRSIGYGIDSFIIDGMDPVAVYVGLEKAVKKMRSHPFPFFIEGKTYRFYHHGGGLAGSNFGYRSKSEEKKWQAKDPINSFPEKLFKSGVLTETENEALRQKAQASIAAAVNFSTIEKGGQRYIPNEKWPAADSLTRDLRCEENLFSEVQFVEKEDFDDFEPLTYVQAISRVTLRNMQRDGQVIVMGEEVANLRGGAYQATRGIKEVLPERLINTPISEDGFVGIAGGASSRGLHPVVEIMFPDFALVAADQLFNQIGKLRHMYGGRASFPLVVRTRAAYGYGYGGQHSMNPAGLFALFSGWRIVAPSNAFDYVGLFNSAMRFKDPVLVIEHGWLYADVDKVPTDDLDYFVAYGRAKVLRPGSDVTVLAYLTAVKDCMEAAKFLAEQGLSAEVIDLRTLDYTGMDYESIGRSVKKTGSVVIVEKTPRSMGLAGRLSDEIQERFYDYLDCPIGKVSAADVPLPVSKALETAMLPSISEIKDKMVLGARHQF